MGAQLDFFTPPPPTEAEEIARHRRSWESPWGWTPEVGGFCSVHGLTAVLETPRLMKDEDDGHEWHLKELYCYTETCRLLEERPDGSWLAVIEMGEHDWFGNGVHRWHKDGTRLILPILNMWPPVNKLSERGY